ncbi:hypothetical protein VTK56DRAFT_9098 [Thermocarpiscus australiensis]
MSDAYSIAAGIAALLPLVRESFVMIRDVFVSERALRFYLARVEMQKAIFQAWDDGWMESGRPDQAIQDFAIAKTLSARGIFQQLVLLLRTLTDHEKLKLKYGLCVERNLPAQRPDNVAVEMKHVSSYLYDIDGHFSTKDLAKFEDNRARHMAFMQNVRFLISGSDSELKEMIGRLDEFNRNLQLFATSRSGEILNRRIFELVVKDISADPDRTRRLTEAAVYEAKHSIDSGAKKMYENLARFANFSLALKSATADMSSRKIFSRRDFSFDSPYKLSPHATLARLFDYPTKYQSRLVLVEWVDISRSTSVKAEADGLKRLWFVLHAEKPEKLLLPASLGLIHDESDPTIVGLVLQLPPHIRGNLPTKPLTDRAGEVNPRLRLVRSPSTIAAQRMPTSLRQLILLLKSESRGLDLGIRFKIAKKLLDALHLMHTSGWIHRNIRPDNILFFPSPGRSGDPDPSTLDFTHPLLVGFHNAPLEIESAPETVTPKTQPEGLKPILKNRNPPPAVAIECYQHPERRRNASAIPFRRQYDLYSVGCVLLELGLCETLENLCGRDIAARARHPGADQSEEDVWKDAGTVRKAAKGLDSITGSIYADVTRTCLSLSPIAGDIIELERGLAAALAQCQA